MHVSRLFWLWCVFAQTKAVQALSLCVPTLTTYLSTPNKKTKKKEMYYVLNQPLVPLVCNRNGVSQVNSVLSCNPEYVSGLDELYNIPHALTRDVSEEPPPMHYSVLEVKMPHKH